MRKDIDPLYFVFEQHLYTALVEDETTDAFLERVVADYLGRLNSGGTTVPQTFRETLETDLRDEVLEMLRKKTYGHYNLASYRQAQGIEVASPAPKNEHVRSRRTTRAC